MDIKERVETTRFLTATVSVDVLKQAAISLVKREAEIGDDAQVVVSEADFDTEQGIAVTIAVKQAAPADSDGDEVPTVPLPAKASTETPAPAVSLTPLV